MTSSSITQNQQSHIGLSAKDVQGLLVAYLAKKLSVAPESIDPNEPFYGHIIGGYQSSGMLASLENRLGVKLSPAIFYEYPDIATLSHHIVKEKLRSVENNKSDGSSQIQNKIPKLINRAARIFRH